jgi:hypothetical protein
MFELRQGDDGRERELVAQARTARKAGHASFQVFARHDGDDEFEAARVVDLVEAEGWTLENAAHAAERANDWAYGVHTATVVGTIYTFGATA